jgi:hypothetical protein
LPVCRRIFCSFLNLFYPGFYSRRLTSPSLSAAANILAPAINTRAFRIIY